MRVIMCVNNWPEPDQIDFEVFPVKSTESEKEALARAAQAYGPDEEFYVEDRR